MKCDFNCFECPYENCINDDLSPEEIAMSEWLDNLVEKESECNSDEVIRTGKRGRPRKVFPTYQTEEYKRKQLAKRKAYYHAHKEERLAYQNKYNALHKEELAQKDHERYLKNAEVRKAKQKANYRKNMLNPDFVEKERVRSREYYYRKKAIV